MKMMKGKKMMGGKKGRPPPVMHGQQEVSAFGKVKKPKAGVKR